MRPVRLPAAAGAAPLVIAGWIGARPSLAKYLDMPWCRGDLYYVAKCTWTLRAYDGWRFEKIQ